MPTQPAGRAIAERPVAPDPTIADPAPLGLAAFALTTFILSLSNANVWPSAAATAVGAALAYGGVVQLLAGMWEFKRNNTFGATAFASYGGFWIAFFFIVMVVKSADENAVGVFLMGWAIFTAYMTIASLRVSGAVFVVFLLLTITFVLLTLGDLANGGSGLSDWTKAGGWTGVATAAAAWYASFAGVTNSTFGRVILPTFPLTRPAAGTEV
jgi:succinate-acetate transporter protein